MQSWRLSIARAICRRLPPLAAPRVRNLIYPIERARRDDREFCVRALTGSRFTHRTSDFHAYPFAVHGWHEWRHWAIARALCGAGDTIVEVGANVGTETVGFADLVGASGHVYAFEPLPENLHVLERNAALNGHEQIDVLPLAVGDRCQTVRFAEPPSPDLSGVGYVVHRGRDEGKTIEVECVTLDSLAERIGPARILFIDAEGSEVPILRGARLFIEQNAPAIVIEASPQNLARAGFDVAALREQLERLGYCVLRIGRLGLRPTDPSATPDPLANWLCLPASRRQDASKVRRSFLACGLLPIVRGLNPLSTPGRG